MHHVKTKFNCTCSIASFYYLAVNLDVGIFEAFSISRALKTKYTFIDSDLSVAVPTVLSTVIISLLQQKTDLLWFKSPFPLSKAY